MKTKKDWLIGQWHTVDGVSNVIFDVNKSPKGFKVRAFDNDNKKELIVSKIRWDGKCLRFETYMPSLRWRTRNCLKPVSRTKLVQELTFWERWEKLRGRAG
jgi:hypothetical protein